MKEIFAHQYCGLRVIVLELNSKLIMSILSRIRILLLMFNEHKIRVELYDYLVKFEFYFCCSVIIKFDLYYFQQYVIN